MILIIENVFPYTAGQGFMIAFTVCHGSLLQDLCRPVYSCSVPIHGWMCFAFTG